MFNVLSEINWLAVLAATVVNAMLGGAWYMGLFKKQYAASLGRTDLSDQKQSPFFIVGPLICGLMVVLTDALLLRALNVTNYSDVLTFGAITGAGYLVAQTVNIAINPNFPRPCFYSAISGSYSFMGTSSPARYWWRCREAQTLDQKGLLRCRDFRRQLFGRHPRRRVRTRKVD